MLMERFKQIYIINHFVLIVLDLQKTHWQRLLLRRIFGKFVSQISFLMEIHKQFQLGVDGHSFVNMVVDNAKEMLFKHVHQKSINYINTLFLLLFAQNLILLIGLCKEKNVQPSLIQIGQISITVLHLLKGIISNTICLWLPMLYLHLQLLSHGLQLMGNIIKRKQKRQLKIWSNMCVQFIKGPKRQKLVVKVHFIDQFNISYGFALKSNIINIIISLMMCHNNKQDRVSMRYYDSPRLIQIKDQRKKFIKSISMQVKKAKSYNLKLKDLSLQIDDQSSIISRKQSKKDKNKKLEPKSPLSPYWAEIENQRLTIRTKLHSLKNSIFLVYSQKIKCNSQQKVPQRSSQSSTYSALLKISQISRLPISEISRQPKRKNTIFNNNRKKVCQNQIKVKESHHTQIKTQCEYGPWTEALVQNQLNEYNFYNLYTK